MGHFNTRLIKSDRWSIMPRRCDLVLSGRALYEQGHKAMRRSPYYQGELDGLYGMYAIINTFIHLTSGALDREDADVLFYTLLDPLPKRRFPDVILDGTTFADLKRMAVAAKNWVNERLADSPYRVRLLYSSQDKNIRKMEKFWDIFDPELNDDVWGSSNSRPKEPDAHWACVYKSASTRIHFYDSNGSDHRKNRSYIGLDLSTSPNKFRLDYKQTVIIKEADGHH